MTSGNTFPNRLTEIDELMRSDHSYLSEDDKCYFLGEYTARQGYAYSGTNNLILNFKKSVDRRNRFEWRYKVEAVKTVAAAFRMALREEVLSRLTFVPIPPSKSIDDPLYDDRLTQMLSLIRPDPALDIREIIRQESSTDPVHLTGNRPTPEEIKCLYSLNESLVRPAPQGIVLVDDVLTTGAHFRAAKDILSTLYPTIMTIGLFIAT